MMSNLESDIKADKMFESADMDSIVYRRLK